MGRVVVTSGGASRSKSKFKPIKKPLTNCYFDVGGELILSSTHAILREKDLVKGSFTGREYKLPIKNVTSNLPSQYKDIKSLEVVCTLRSQKKEIKSIENKTFQQKYIYKYWITHFHHCCLTNEVVEVSFSNKETIDNPSTACEITIQNNNIEK